MSEEGVARHDPTQPPSIDRTQARALFVNRGRRNVCR